MCGDGGNDRDDDGDDDRRGDGDDDRCGDGDSDEGLRKETRRRRGSWCSRQGVMVRRMEWAMTTLERVSMENGGL
jgi:hypothetical protein